MSPRIITPYEAHCAAYWLHKHHGYYKSHAAAAVDRGGQKCVTQYNWFRRFVDDDEKAIEANRKSTNEWKNKNREANRARDREFLRYTKTPYYQTLKTEVGDLRVLKRNGTAS